MNKPKGYNPHELEQTREYKAFHDLTTELNSGSFNRNAFAACLPTLHPTLQQLLFKLMQTCILFMAEEGNVSIDDRNRTAYEACRSIADTLRDIHLPLI